jgi:hypothetical protein
MHVKKHDAIAFMKRRAVDAGQRPAQRIDHARGDVTRNNGIRNACKPAVPEMHVGAAHFGTGGAQQSAAWWKIGSGELANLNGLSWSGHHRGEDACAHTVTLSLKRMMLQTVSIAWLVATLSTPNSAQASAYHPQQAPRRFVSVSYDWQYSHPMGFGAHPLEDLLGRPVSEVHLESFNYRTGDGQTRINVLEFGNRGEGVGVTVYPFGSSVGPTLAVRGSIERLPPVRVTFDGPAPFASYTLTGGRSYDLGVGVDVSDRAPGWGLGSHAFLLGGIGRTRTDQRDGTRYFAEAGGGLATGPIGVDLSVKLAVNRFSSPVPHRFFTIPVSVRGTFTF